jgi:hypothetical protein
MTTLMDLPQDNPSVQRLLTSKCHITPKTLLTSKLLCDYIYILRTRCPRSTLSEDLKVILVYILAIEQEPKPEPKSRCWFCW